MNLKLTIKNYRCFEYSKPLVLELKDGFTAFIGVNNSGKSTALKICFEVFGVLRGRLSRGEDHAARLKEATFGSNCSESILCNRNSRPMSIDVEVFPQHAENRERTVDRLELVFTRIEGASPLCSAHYWSDGNRIEVPSAVEELKYVPQTKCIESSASVDIGDESDTQLPMAFPPVNIECLMSELFYLFNAMYIGPVRMIIPSSGMSISHFNMSLGSGFVDQWNNYKSGRYPARLIDATDHVQEDIRRIFGFERFEINASSPRGCLLVKINGKTYEVDEVGSGLSQFIAMLAEAAFRQPALLLIDEPELSLHASLQLDFLTTLAKYANENIVFATHNLGLARQSNARILAFHRDEKGRSVAESYERTPRLAEFLGALSFTNSSDIGFEQVLLVEGRTDVLTVQQWLKLYGKEHTVMLIPLGGSAYFTMKEDLSFELAEFKRICPQVSVLIDSEKVSKDSLLAPERADFIAKCNELAFRCHVLERRATENYLTQDAIQEILGSQYSKLGPFESLKSAKKPWKKELNWRIAQRMRQEDIEDTDLGGFLREL